jgi:Mg2+-importing ATPase
LPAKAAEKSIHFSPILAEVAHLETAAVFMTVAAWLPHSPLAPALGFTALPPLYWPILLVTLLCYVVLTQAVKMWLIRKAWL